MNIPHIRSYARAYTDYRNILVTEDDTPFSAILDCYPMRTIDNFLLTDDERVMAKFFVRSISVMEDSASEIFKLASGELNGWQIADHLLHTYGLGEEKRQAVERDTADFLQTLDRNFSVVLVRPIDLGSTLPRS